jgi:4-amino-4-deoxy-L-arabinose transferase-like glycosyltransferase
MTATAPDLRRQRGWRARRSSVELRRVKENAPLAALLGLTAILYLWGLSRNGWANEYYAAAVQAGTHSWKAFLFGSLDAANYITVDKPPAALWLMELSSRLFGFSSFSMLLPQALEGVGAVWLLYATVGRWFDRPAALLSGLILALTPVAALMFGFNNPDALLVLVLVASAYALTRALENGQTRWLALAGAALGLGFLTKELQAFLVLPGFALAYLVAAPVSLRRRIWQLLVAGAALAASAGWWVALVELWPASARPYIGGSTDNSILQLIFGYNGFSRISSGGGGGAGGSGFSGAAGVLRLFDSELGGQIGWLLPAAVIALIAGVAWTARRPRTDRTRAALLLWGGWLVVTAAVYSLMTGIVHPYYTATLAPAIAALVAVGTVILWRRRDRLGARLVLAGMLAITGVWSYALLERTPDWHPWLRFAILAGTALAAAAICAGTQLNKTARTSIATVGLIAALAGPAAYTLSTVATVHSGSNPSAGPAVASTGRFGGAGFSGRAPSFVRGVGAGGGQGEVVSGALASLLERDSARYTWVAATSSAQTAASLELATGKSVIAIGGFSGSDPGTTLAHFKRLVAEGKVHYYIAGGGFGGRAGLGRGVASGSARGYPGASEFPRRRFAGGGGGTGQTVASQIQSWVQSQFKARTVGGVTVYDLTQPKVG